MRSVSDELSAFAFRMWWRRWGAAGWLPGQPLFVQVDDGAVVDLEQLSWTTDDDAQSAIGFAPEMASCYGHRRTAGGDLVELRGELEGPRHYPESAREYVFDTEIGDVAGRCSPGQLRVLIGDGDEAPLRSMAWHDRSGNACSVTLRSVSPSGNIDVTDLVTAVRASAEHPDAGEVAANLVDESAGKWFAPYDHAWLEFTLSQPVVLDRYVLTSANDAPDRDPATWTLLGSADGNRWRPLDTRTDQSFATRHQSMTYRISEPASYDHYRLDIRASNGSPDLQLDAVRFRSGGSGFSGYRQSPGHPAVAYRGVRVLPEPRDMPAELRSVGTPKPRRTSTDPRPVFEDSAPVTDITPERYLYRMNAKGIRTQTITRTSDGSLRATDRNMSWSLGIALTRWLEQEDTVLTWRELPSADGLDLTLCLADADGNLLWRESSAISTTTPPPAEPHDYGCPTLGLGSRLRGQSLTSPSGSYTLLHHDDGNLVLYRNATHTPVWATGTDWLGDSWLDLTSGGDLILRTSCGAPVWQSGTADAGVERLTVRDDGTLALLDAAGTAVWHVHDPAPRPVDGHLTPRGAVLRRGQTLRNQSLTADDGGAVLRQQPEQGVRLFDAEESSCGARTLSPRAPTSHSTRTDSFGSGTTTVAYSNNSPARATTSPWCPAGKSGCAPTTAPCCGARAGTSSTVPMP